MSVLICESVPSAWVTYKEFIELECWESECQQGQPPRESAQAHISAVFQKQVVGPQGPLQPTMLKWTWLHLLRLKGMCTGARVVSLSQRLSQLQ